MLVCAIDCFDRHAMGSEPIDMKARLCKNRLRSTVLLLAMFVLGVPLSVVGRADQYTEVYPALVGYDSTQHIHIHTPAEADTVRQSVIEYVWSSGQVPTDTMPTSVSTVYSGMGSLPGQLGNVDPSYVASVERLDMSTDDLETFSYLVHPATPAPDRRLAIVHQGHQSDMLGGLDDAANLFLQYGFDVLAMNMPLLGWNPDHTLTLPDGTSATIGDHSQLMNAFGAQGDNGFRFFVDPVVTGINYFVDQFPEYDDIVMTGLSGGGWTSHIVPAVDERIRLSIPAAGSVPLYIRDVQPSSVGDLEQTWPGLYVDTASWLDLYILAGYGEGREQIQVLNQYDSCCFWGVNYTTYEENVVDAVENLGAGEWSFRLDSTHSSHLISSFTLNQVILPAILPEGYQAWNGIDGDVNQNGIFFGDGTGPAESDDVTAFLDVWGTTGLPGVLGTYESYTHGDLNFDGQSDLEDAVSMWLLLVQQGTSTSALAQLFVDVPEPPSCLLVLFALSGLSRRSFR